MKSAKRATIDCIFILAFVILNTGVISAISFSADFDYNQIGGINLKLKENSTVGNNHIIQFYDMSTGNPTGWYWDFGDGTYSTEQNPRHYYYQAGTYDVTLTIGNEKEIDSIKRTISVTDFEAKKN